MSIDHFVEKIKGALAGDGARDVLTIGIIVIVGIGSFFLGRWSNIEVSRASQAPITEPAPVEIVQTNQSSQTEEKAPESTVPGSFFASKNGTKYYPEGCSGINRIKPENLIGFETEAVAQATGRTKSSVCK